MNLVQTSLAASVMILLVLLLRGLLLYRWPKEGLCRFVDAGAAAAAAAFPMASPLAGQPAAGPRPSPPAAAGRPTGPGRGRAARARRAADQATALASAVGSRGCRMRGLLADRLPAGPPAFFPWRCRWKTHLPGSGWSAIPSGGRSPCGRQTRWKAL